MPPRNPTRSDDARLLVVENMHALRVERGWTWSELARRSGVKAQVLQKIRETRREIYVNDAIGLASAFDVDLEDFLTVRLA